MNLKLIIPVLILVLNSPSGYCGDRCYYGNPDNQDLESSGSSGSITSPNYPSNYPGNLDCTWTITVPDGHYIYIDFTFFRLQDAFFLSCVDWVEIYDSDEWLGKYCGRKSALAMELKTNKAKIKFHSDGFWEFKGFYMKYEARQDNSLSVGAIIGIVIGLLVIIIVIIVLSVVCCCKKSSTSGTVVETTPQNTTTSTVRTVTGGTTVAYTSNSQAVQFVQAPQVYTMQATAANVITLPASQPVYQTTVQKPPPYSQPPPTYTQQYPTNQPNAYNVPGAPDVGPTTLPQPPPPL